MDLHVFWFLMLGVLLSGYGVLDGFDLGVGILHINVTKDEERRILMNSIGPIWDGNEVWLVVLGGALFAAFPVAYATVFSGLYLPFGPDGEFAGTLADVFKPYSILTGIFAIATFAMHGSIYLYIKTEGELQKKVHGWMWTTFGMFLVLYLLVTVVTLTTIPASREKYERMPWLWIVVVLNILAIANIPRAIYMNRPIYAFLSSSATIVAFTFLFGTALFPNLVVSTLQPPDPALGSWNLDVYNSASSESTLWLMAVIAFVGLPFVLSYTFTIYWVFRGKVRLDRLTY